MLYEYTNKERELIASCFRGGNYHALRDLPDQIAPNQVMQAFREKMDYNVNESEITQNLRKPYDGLK